MTEDLFCNDTFDSSSFLLKLDAKITNRSQNLNEETENIFSDPPSTTPLEKEEVVFDDSLFLSESLSFNAENFETDNDVSSTNTETFTPLLSEPEKVVSTQDETQIITTQSLSGWGIPESVLQRYCERKITKMFQWQVDCLNLEGVMQNSNLVYSAPTSAGKTLVAEILAMKTVFERKKKVLFILPFVSVVREKTFYFQDILSANGIRAEGFMGSYNPPGGFHSVQVAVCTIEKANNLINRMLEENTLSEVGAVVIDEMHLLGDQSRGYLLELLLTKLRYMTLKDPEIKIQIIGMSATLPNLTVLAKWLDAQLYTTAFRPIPLEEQVLINSEIYSTQLKLIRTLKPLPELGTDTDNILQLCLETISKDCSVLIFCPTKNWCENLSQQIASAFCKLGNSGTALGQTLRNQLNTNLIMELLEQLKRCPVGLDKILEKAVSFGVAFHHAGLTMDERDIIEGAFRNGVLRVLVATSTLSSGVNLPARRVIIRTPIFHGRPIDALTYRQMIGRAGRMGKDSEGESILICQKNDYGVAKELLSANLQPINSCLEASGRLKRAVLEVIASGVVVTPEDLKLFVSCTLLAAEEGDDFSNPIGETVEFLHRNEFIRLQVSEDGTSRYLATGLGKACLASSLPPEEGLALFTELEKARQCFVLDSELHLVYLVTPYSASNQWTNLDWMHFLGLWERLPRSMKRVGDLVGVCESYIVNATRGKIQTNTSKAYQKLMIHKRFYTALALQDLVNEVRLNEVAEKFNCNRGMLQSLQQSASTFAGMVTSFSRQLGWSSVEILVSQFQDRLQFGVSRDLLDLMRLPILTGHRARCLYNAGIQTLAELASSNVYTLENVLHKALPFESEKDEDGNDRSKKNECKIVWVAGKQGLTEREAACMLIEEARKYLLLEMGVVKAEWQSESEGDAQKNKDKLSDVDEFELKLSPASSTTTACSLVLKPEQAFSDESLFDNSLNDNETMQKRRLSDDDFIATSQSECVSIINDCTPVKKHRSTSRFSSFGSPRKKSKTHRIERALTVNDTIGVEEIQIVDVCEDENLFQTFCNELRGCSVVSVSLGCRKVAETKPVIGMKQQNKTKEFQICDRKLDGVAVSWGQNHVFYMSFADGNEISKPQKLSLLTSLFSNRLKTARIFDAKEQLKVLHECCGITVNCNIEDPKVADWLLDPEGKEKNLQALAVKYLPSVVALSQLAGSCRGVGSVALELNSSISSRIRASVESIVNYHLVDAIRQVLAQQDLRLLDIYDTEMKTVVCLADMEVEGFGVSTSSLNHLVTTLKNQQLVLENQAFSLAGRRFSMSSSRDVAKAIGIYKGKRVSTNKKVLERNENLISKIVMQWRKLNATLTKMVYPFLRMAEDERIRGRCITHSATGRITMQEPNLQNVARDFDVVDPISGNRATISCRDSFLCRESYILLSADYCQLELRLLAHLSGDVSLVAVMNTKEDLFKSIAAKLNGISNRLVTDEQRQHAKQICYGIIYGMGTKTLSEQLDVSEEDAAEFMESFHCKYPGIKRYIQKVIEKCRKDGFVESISGRRRYLPNINHENSAIKSQAERQAVNTTIQGSAADIAKKAMVDIEKKLADTYQTARPKLVLHLHDELLYEVPDKQLKCAAKIVKKCMEEGVNLSVSFPVKLKAGPSWGQLKELIL